MQQYGEEEVEITLRISKGLDPQPLRKRRPLTIDDYFQEEDPEQLRKRWLERQRQWKEAQERREKEWQLRKKTGEERRRQMQQEQVKWDQQRAEWCRQLERLQ